MYNHYSGGFRRFREFGDFFDNPDMMTGIMAVMGVLAIIVLLILAFSAAIYVFRSLALHRLAANRGMSNPGLAWIPVVGIFRAGAIADDINVQNGSKTYFRFLILGGTLATFVFSGAANSITLGSMMGGRYNPYGDPFMGYMIASQMISVIATGISIATLVITIISLNKIYKIYKPLNSTSWTVLSVIFPFLQAFFLFSIRNNEPVPDCNQQPNYYQPPQNWQTPPNGYAPPPVPQDPGYPAPQPPEYEQSEPPQTPQIDQFQPPKAPEPDNPWDNPKNGR